MGKERKGHLILKSSPLSITSNTYLCQAENESNLLSHFNRIYNAKPCVDTSPPKSVELSQKRRDQKLRQKLVENPNLLRLSTARSFRPNTTSVYNDDPKPFHNSYTPVIPSKPSYDVLQYHSESFTQPDRPFTPRILQRSSALVEKVPMHKKENVFELERSKTHSAEDVPRLNIEEDKDKRRYLDALAAEQLQQRRLREHRERAERILDDVRESVKLKLEEQNEERMYLKFVNNVTADIIKRNISTPSVMKQMIDRHIELNKNFLDENKMRCALKNVERELGIFS